MKQYYAFLLSILMLPVAALGQSSHEMLVQPYSTSNQVYLNDVIAGDTTNTGARIDSNRVYVLVRGGTYFLNYQIINRGWTLSIKAQDSTGAKPAVFLIRNAVTNKKPGDFVQNYGNVWLKNILIGGYYDANPYDSTLIGDMPGGLVDEKGAGYTVVIDSCILTECSGQPIRFDGAPKDVFITNTIFANMGYLGTSNLGAGKGLDMRAGSCDTLLLQNCTFVNAQDRVIRHLASTGALNHVIFDHNTVVNDMSYHGMLSLGWIGTDCRITNNLFIDPFALGNDTDATREVEFAEGGEINQFGGPRMTWVLEDSNSRKGNVQWMISNNYYSISDSGQAFYDRYAAAGVGAPFPGTPEGSPLTWFINKQLEAQGGDSTTAFTKEKIDLKMIPTLMTAEMDWYRSPNGGNKTKNTPTSLWNFSDDMDRVAYTWIMDTLDCSYPTSANAYTGGMKGFPAGDLNWFPSQKDQWLVTAVKEKNNSVPSDFTLHQNYPNPFNPTTQIAFSIPQSMHVTVTIFNVLGQRIATLVDGNMSAGSHMVTWNARNVSGEMVPTGVYFYRLSTPSFTAVKKMLLLK